MWALLDRGARRGWRALASHAFDLGVLLPIVGLAFLLLAGRTLEVFRGAIADLLAEPATGPQALAALAVVSLAISWPGLWQALYGRAAQVELLDVLPIPERQRFGLLLLSLPARALPASLLWTAGAYVLADIGENPAWSAFRTWGWAWCGQLLVVAWALALAQAAAHWRLARAASLAILFTLLLLAAISPWGAWLAAPFAVAGRFFHVGWADACGLPSAGLPFAAWLGLLLLALAVAAALFRQRRQDLEQANAQSDSALAWPGLAGRPHAANQPSPAGRALHGLVRRDLRWVVRAFSPGVPLALGAWALLTLALVRGLLVFPLEAENALRDFQRLAVALSGVALLPWFGLAPWILARRLRHGWLESQLGVPHEVQVQASYRSAWLLGWLPALLHAGGVAGITLARTGDGGLATLLVLQLASVHAMAATVLGLAAWELPGEPWLAAVYGWILASLFLGLVVVAPFWLPAWWLLFAMVFVQLRGRALARAQFLELRS